MQKIGSYEIVDRLGRGGMGVVWRARHQETGEQVALKTLEVPHPRLLSSIRREIRALAGVTHPGVAQILDSGVHDGKPWYAMQLIQGHSLRRFYRGMHLTDRLARANTHRDTVPAAQSLQAERVDWHSDALVSDTPGQTAPLVDSASASTSIVDLSTDRVSVRDPKTIVHARETSAPTAAASLPLGGPLQQGRLARTNTPTAGLTSDAVPFGPPKPPNDVDDLPSSESADGTGGVSVADSGFQLEGTSPIELFSEEHPGSSQSGSSRSTHTQLSEKRRLGSGFRHIEWDFGRLAPMLQLLKHLCDTLAYLHGIGLVHGDLKPENVMVDDQGYPILVDFGLTARFGSREGREALAAGLFHAGTPGYMAPEQIRGELLDARTDIYALGALLYEALSGAPPKFDRAGRLSADLANVIDPPDFWCLGLPSALNDLTLRCLAPRPMDRVGHVAAIGAVLHDLFNEAGAVLRIQDNLPEPAPYLYRARLVGRDQERRTVMKRLERLVNRDRGGVLVIEGESGVGKTRFAAEVARHAHRLRITIASGECLPPVEGAEAAALGVFSAFIPLVNAVADRIQQRGQDECDRLLGRDRAVLESTFERLANCTPNRTAPPAELPAAESRQRSILAVQSLLTAYAAVAPLLLVIDDLQWADELSVALLAQIGRRPHGIPGALILGSYRSELESESLRALGALAGVTKTRLSRLSRPAVRALVSSIMADPNPPEGLITLMVKATEGNPYFVAEYCRAAVTEGLLQQTDRGTWTVDFIEVDRRVRGLTENLALPSTLFDMIGGRLDRLGSEERRVLDAAAVIGREIPLALLEALTEVELANTENDASDTLYRLLLAEVLEPSEDNDVRFVHDKIREVAYRQIAATERIRLHLRTAELLSGDYAAYLSDVGQLALHWDRGLRAKAAAPAYRKSAQQAMAGGLSDLADASLTAFLALTDGVSPAQRADALLDLAHVRGLKGDLKGSGELGQQALDLSRSLGHTSNVVRALKRMSLVASIGGRRTEAYAALTEALDLARDIGDRALELDVLMEAVIDQGRFHDLAQAKVCAELAVQIAVELDDSAQLARCYSALSALQRLQSKTLLAVQTAERAVEYARQVPEHRHLLALCLARWAIPMLDLKQIERCEAVVNEALVIFRQIGDRRWENLMLAQLAGIFYGNGQYRKAAEALESVSAVADDIGDGRMAGAVRTNIASCLVECGDFVEAHQVLMTAIGELENSNALDHLPVAYFLAGRLARLLGHSNDVLAGWIDKLARRGERSEDAESSLLACQRGHYALRLGNPAEPDLARARQLIDEHGGTGVDYLERPYNELEQAIAEGHQSRS